MGIRAWMVWLIWLGSIAALSWFLWSSLSVRPETQFLIGPMSSGHHQIGVQCEACHTEPFGGSEALQDACVQCHGAELKQARDSHPRSKFTDPRNIDRVAHLDARACVTCHREHSPEITRVMGVTLPQDYCVLCHEDIGRERATHKGLDFATCASAGCHNFHDNQALYEDFLLKHADQPAVLAHPRLPARQPSIHAKPGAASKPLRIADADGPSEFLDGHKAADDWLASAHARGGVNCGDCHQDQSSGAWRERPDFAVCGSCHDAEREGFLSGKHGMRLQQGLSAMAPASARAPMRADAPDRTLHCGTCHAPHRLDTARAAVTACLGCHADEHSRAFRASPHGALWAAAQKGRAHPDSGVSCATCHLPRVPADGAGAVRVQHNQNANLRPNEKMIRDVCMACHGLGFAIDALADRALIRSNFQGKPARHVQSIDWALRHEQEAARDKQRAAATGTKAVSD